MSISTASGRSIHVQIKLFANLSKYLPPDSEYFELPAGATAADLTARLNLPAEQMKLIFINGCRQALDTVLNDKDRIGIFPPVGGG